MKPWWRRAEVWLWAAWSVGGVLRFSRGRLWGLPHEPGSWLNLLLATATFAAAIASAVTGGSVLDAPDAAVVPDRQPALVSRHVALRTGLGVLAAACFAVSILVGSDDDRIVGGLVFSAVLGAVVGVGGLLETWARPRGAGHRFVAGSATAVLTAAGVFVAILQADYARQVLSGRPPELATSELMDALWISLSRHAPLALGAAVGHAGLILGRSAGSFRVVATLLVLLLILFLVALLGAQKEEPITDAGGGLFAAALFLGFAAFSAWGADALEQWWWGTSDEESRDGLEGPPR